MVALDTDGEEIEYAEFSEDRLLLERAKLKKQLAETDEGDAYPDPDQGDAETD